MDTSTQDLSPSPAPWAFAVHMYGIAHCVIDRDGRVISSHLRVPNGQLMAEAPAMAALLREIVKHGDADLLRSQAAAILCRIDRGRDREPGEDDE